MTDHTELVQRLRTYGGGSARLEAADAIEQQAAEIAKLRADAERLRNERAVYGRWMYESMLTLHTLVDEDSEDGSDALRLLIDRGERLADATLHFCDTMQQEAK